MTATSKIEWTETTWNPVTGCTKVSPGCDHCYAEKITERFHGKGSFTEVKLHPDRLDAPLRWRKPRRVFVNSMSDLFHDQVPDEFIAQVFAVMAATPQHTYQILTKRHGRMRSLLDSKTFLLELGLIYMWGASTPDDAPVNPGWPLPNVHLGVSVEDQKRADLRIPALVDTPAAVRFLSCEPLLGSVDLSRWTGTDTELRCGCGMSSDGVPIDQGCSAGCMEPEFSGLDWVIVGGESGPDARPMHPDWARQLRDQCTEDGVPFFFKQWGEWRPLAGNECAQVGDEWPSDTWGQMSRRVGKKAAGRELDGRTWDEYPTAVPA